MKITVTCDECSNDEQEVIPMEPVGNRFTNRETKSQAQAYKCKGCKKEVTVILEAE